MLAETVREAAPQANPALSWPRVTIESVDGVAWLVRLRWIAVGCVTFVIAVSGTVGVLPHPIHLGAFVLALALANAGFSRWARRLSEEGSWGARHDQHVALQLLTDLAILTGLLYWSGGVDNPFVTFYVFPMALAGMLLPLRNALGLAVAAIVMHGSILVGEALDLLPHHALMLGPERIHGLGTPDARWYSGPYVTAYILAFTATALGVIYFVHAVVQRLRRAELRRLQHERVARSRERLARIGTVAAGVAHTVRNPLHGLLSGVDTLRARAARGQPMDPEILDLMQEGVGRIERVTRSLLALGRGAPPSVRPTSVRHLAEDAIHFVEVRAREQGVTVDVETGSERTVSVDPDQVIEALVNILDNAIHACRAGGHVRLLVADDPDHGGAQAVLEITDSGPGMTRDVMAQVFDPFFTTKPVGEGSGLGLAITRRIVEAHGGEVDVASEPGNGTTVRILLPRDAVPEAP